jgi:hypothetical protein
MGHELRVLFFYYGVVSSSILTIVLIWALDNNMGLFQMFNFNHVPLYFTKLIYTLLIILTNVRLTLKILKKWRDNR